MRAGRGTKSTTTIAAACLAFSLLGAGCTPAPPDAGPQGPGPLPTVSLSPVPSAPAPTVAESSGPVALPTLAPPASATPSATGPSTASATASATATPVPSPSLGVDPTEVTGPAVPAPVVEPTAAPSALAPATRGPIIPVDASGPAVYYVAIDDGGARGVRFGCNDSLVPVRGVAEPGDPLTVALGRLLAGMPLDSDAALYDALAQSSLKYLSGYMNGSTVVVNLSGSLRPGGVCDVPRIQAQLTQTIVAASGATRAEIYINGRTLVEALSVR